MTTVTDKDFLRGDVVDSGGGGCSGLRGIRHINNRGFWNLAGLCWAVDALDLFLESGIYVLAGCLGNPELESARRMCGDGNNELGGPGSMCGGYGWAGRADYSTGIVLSLKFLFFPGPHLNTGELAWAMTE